MIGSNAMLVELNIPLWTARKMDKKVSEEVDNAKGTRARGGNYHKNLLAGSDKLERIQKIAGAARTWHYENTLPWTDKGARLLPMKSFFDYKQTLNNFEVQFTQAVNDFCIEYPQLVSKSAFTLGGLFDRDEYPDVEKVRNKFGFKYSFSPVPEAGDFRVDVEEEALNELKEQYESMYKKKLDEAMQDTWQRLHDVLTHMSQKLDFSDDAVDENGNKIKRSPFHTSTITNAVELCGLLTKLNITNDPKLEAARQQLERALVNIDADTVKESQEIRHSVKAKVDAILDMFGD
jgi:hypothetical protein